MTRYFFKFGYKDYEISPKVEMTKFVSEMTKFVGEMTKFVGKMTKFVSEMTKS